MSQSENKMSCSAWIAIIGLIIAIVAFVFGDNLYQQITGHSFFSSGQNTSSVSAPTTTKSTNPSATSPSVQPVAVESMLPASPGQLLFSDSFDDGFAHGFNFYSGDWKVVDDGTGNNVLQAGNNTNASFGPSDFSDGIIEFRVKVVSGDYQAKDHVMELGIRNLAINNQDWTEYILDYDPAPPPGLTLYYQEKSGGWQPVEGINGNGAMQNSPESWFTLRVEAQGKNIKVFVNGKPFITAYDSRIRQGGLYLGNLGNLVVQFDDFRVWNMTL